MTFGNIEFSFIKVDYSLGYFPIILKCWISCFELGVYFVKL